MLKSIAMVCSESTTKHKNKTSYNTDYIVPDLSDLFVDEKQSKCRLKKEIFVFVKSIVLTKNWFVVSNL